jgi:hypothetical protein
MVGEQHAGKHAAGRVAGVHHRYRDRTGRLKYEIRVANAKKEGRRRDGITKKREGERETD